MFCTKCGKQLDDGMKFCTACGAPVSVPGNAPKADRGKPLGEAKAEPETVEVDDAKPETVEADDAKPETDADAEKKPFDLPDSALEPSTPVPVSEERSATALPDETAAMPVVGMAANEAHRTDKPSAGEMPGEPSPKKTRNKAIIGICFAAAVVMIAAIGVLVVLEPFNPDTSIDSDAFPNDAIRGAVLAQLDEDGDGRLSNEEAQLATALVYTPEGAEFVTEGNEVDVQSIRDSIKERNPGSGDAGVEQPESGLDNSTNDDGQRQAGDGSSDVQAQGLEGQGGYGSDFGEELSAFPNIKTFIASDCGLTAIDLSQMPELEYVDLRRNPDLRTFDLASNKNIKVLFCDEETDITGLDEAGLYFTDLVTSMQVSGGLANESYTVEYDTRARLTSVTQRYSGDVPTLTTYSYDDKGRLVKEERAKNDWYTLFAYGENGLLSAAVGSCPLGDYSPPYAYAYGYDGKGNLTQLAEGTATGKSLDGATYSDAGAFSYIDGGLASYKSNDSSILFAMDDSGMLASAVRDGNGIQDMFDCAYTKEGGVSNYGDVCAYQSGTTYSNSYATTYSDAGLPQKTASIEGSSSDETTYECNADGYVTKISWSSSNEFMGGSTGTISYVKRVGSLADRATERFVPVIRPVVDAEPVIGYGNWTPLQNWYASSGPKTTVTMFVLNPFDATSERIGLPTYTLSCPNEEKLSAYDREHWADGLSFGKELPIEAAGVAELLARADEAPLPVSAQTFLDDPVYGAVVKQYLDAMRQSTPPNGYFFDIDNLEKQYPDIPADLLWQLPWGYSSGPTYATVDFSYVDLNQDGVNELVACFPQDVSLGKGAPFGPTQIAVYGQVDGILKLIANGGQLSSCWITSDGCIAYTEGEGIGGNLLEKWNGSKLEIVGGFSYQPSNEGEDHFMKVTPYSSDGNQGTSYNATTMEVYDLANKFRDDNPSTKYNWTPIPVS